MSYQSRKLLSLGAAMLFSVSNLFAQSADEIVKKHNEAVGGTAAWSKVNSIRYTGAADANGVPVNIVITKLRNVGVRQDIDVMGQKMAMVMTPQKGWMITPQSKEPQEMPAEAFQLSKPQLFVGDLVMEMGNGGYKFESAGISTLDGKPVVPGKGTSESDQYYRLKALDAEGNATDLYFDMKTYYLVRTGRMANIEGKETEIGVKYADYQKQPSGVVIPMSQTTETGELKVSKVEMNPTVEAGLFKL